MLLMMTTLIYGVRASTLFMPDSDTAALISLVSNTASTVSNTMKILEVAKKTSEKIDKYNFIAMRRFYIARRIKQHAKDIIDASKMKPKDLREINRLLLRLKMNLRGLRSSIDHLAKDVLQVEDFTSRHYEKLTSSLKDESEARRQELTSASEGPTAKHVQNTAMNTALGTSILSKMRRDHLDYQKVDLGLKKGRTLEELRRENFYEDWIGINKSESFKGASL
jgi:hypothetical protein